MVSDRERTLFGELASLFGKLATPEPATPSLTGSLKPGGVNGNASLPAAVADDLEELVAGDDLEDRRTKSRRVYFLAADADTRHEDIPSRPSACRKVFRYLQKNEVGTVKLIATGLGLDRKTIGNAVSALQIEKLIESCELPKLKGR